MWKLIAALVLVLAGGQHCYAATLTVCVKQLSTKDDDFIASFQHGPIRLPAGAVFDYAGHAFGPAFDPTDQRHQKGIKWIGTSKEEAEKRGTALVSDLVADQRHKAGLITLVERTLTKAKPCAEIPVAAAVSVRWGWTVSPVFGTSDTYYQLFGVIRSGQIDTSFSNDRNSLDYSATRGALNGILSGTTEKNITVSE